MPSNSDQLVLSDVELNFLSHLPPEKANRIIIINPFTQKIQDTASDIMSQIKEFLPQLEVKFMGASGLGISGQNDIDLYILSKPEDFSQYQPLLVQVFGEPANTHPDSIAWKFIQNNFDIELYLTDPTTTMMVRQIKVFETLKSNPQLLAEYAKLKENLNGTTFVEYQKHKYNFYHRILKELDYE